MSSKVENVDIAFEMITEAVESFQGFLLGIPEGDTYQRLTGDMNTNRSEDEDSLKKIREARRVLSNICDRTNGGYALSQIGDDFKTLFTAAYGDDTEGILSISFNGSERFDISENLARSGGTNVEAAYSDYESNGIKEVLKYADPSKFSDRELISGSYGTSDNLSGSVVLNQAPPAGLNSIVTVTSAPGEGIDKFSHPSLGAVIIKDPVFGFNSRNANHFPVFLSAVTPLEISRCTPYLDVKILTKNRSGTKENKMSIHNFLRHEGSNETFKRAQPVGEAYTETLGDVDFNYMDIFTSPQTMVNPNINRSQKGFGDIYADVATSIAVEEGTGDRLFSGTGDKPFEYTNVRDPFQPFMTLLSFNTSITGIGHGLLATKKAHLKIKLHDKTRIKDLSAILSPNEFSQTKFVIEFGWSHPDGNVNSDNVLGRYLNALRDLSIYQLVNADYSFGGDNSVDITLNLVCSGFQEMKTLSAAGGYYTNLNTIIDDIQDDVESLINDASSGGDMSGLTPSETNKKIKEIRGNLKISTSDLSKNSTIVPFERIGEWKETFDKNAERAETVKKLLDFLYGEVYGPRLNEALEAKEYYLFSYIKSRKDSSSPNAGDIIYAKFESLPHGIDPFRAQVVNSFFKGYGVKGKSVHQIPLIGIDEGGNPNPAKYSESGVDEHVSLGKIISMFVGYPLSTAGIYDEVQLFFYPVNTQSAAARKHTTASFPIKMSDLREEIDKRAKAGEQSFRNLSVHAFFAILERIVAKQTITAYGLYPEDSEPKKTQNKLDAFLKKSREEKVSEVETQAGIEISAEVREAISEQAQAQTAADEDGENDVEDITKRLTDSKLIELYETQLAEQISSAREDRLKFVYEAEEEYFGDTFLDKTKFTPVNLAMYFETFAPRNSDKPNDENLVQDFIDLIGSPDKRRDTRDNGKSVEKTILRIHIYDENTNMGPDISLYGSDSINMSKTAIANKNNLSSYTAIKSLLMRRHPTIIHGASSGVVNNISVSSNTSGQLSNILMVEAYEQSINAGTSERKEPDGFDEVVLLPTTVSLDMAGYPMLTRGQQIFIDFGTQTSLDNLYTVKTVDHEIQAGVFKTSAVLQPANQMIVSSFRSRLESLINLVNTGEDSGNSSQSS